ncbi:SOS response-associated peptidase [Tenggerimyces flavus]|uniref:Abasic site processing protein n=1 Tax=Tenggerimyces flavus TaxID=1708749 RepID=A0ABV7Y2J4_9ACTN|nr:SOS response-associated peptidase [Tenggerimyces flavus]MBM7790679.1 putative SOS response-associated peptidase YedK [Tenggerimyces flavus]
MCGRYASSKAPDDLAREFEVDAVDVREKLEPDYNVAPTRQVYAVLERQPREEGEKPDPESEGERRLTTVKWGLVPFWAKDEKIGNKMINARLETAHEKPAFRRSFASRRCLLPADGYYEWYGETKGKKQPFFIHPKDGGTLAMAGLYEIWRDKEKADDDPERFLWTCTVLTTSSTDELGEIHDRMPLVVKPEDYAKWLDPRINDRETLHDLLKPAMDGQLEAYPVSKAVNNVKNNGPELKDPIPADEDGLF